jgi:chaperone required for assembly of F1-ATPase
MRDILNKLDTAASNNPQTTAQQAMRPKLAKRFYKNVSVIAARINDKKDANAKRGFVIHLDGQKLKTPARSYLILPTRQSAQIVANEWLAQKDNIDTATMPATRLVNTARDGIAADPQAVIEDMLKFAHSDLLCYRASAPQGLVELQQSQWDPVLDWAVDELDARFETTKGLVQIAQPKEAISAISIALKPWTDPIAIAALHTITNLTGSIILAVAISVNKYTASQVWKIAHVDEDWNISNWGEDHEAKKRRDNRLKEMEAAYHLFLAIQK